MIKDQVKSQTETEELFQLNKPTLHALSYVLRHPDTWPKGFVWNYNYCTECAMGLAGMLWGILIDEDHHQQNKTNMAKAFAMPYEKVDPIFYNANHRQVLGLFPISMEAVTPEMVADKIDMYLASIK